MKHGSISRLAEAFQTQGKELYLVGGTVRDELLGRPSHDIDCATNALPDEIQQIAEMTTPLHIVSIGEKFGTIQLHYATDGEPLVIEVTTYRGERYTPGSRHPEVQFGTSLVEDLRRRDFTINAIAKDALTGEIVDPFEGQKDLQRHLIRAVENPAQRFADDPLRMLRAIRLACQLEFMIEMQTSSAIIDASALIQSISQERIRDELSKMLVSPHPDFALCVMHSLSLTHYFFPELDTCIGVDQPPHHNKDVFMHTMMVVQATPPRLTVRLAALLHDIAKPRTKTVDEHGVAHFYEHEDIGSEMARAILRRLRFGNDVVEQVAKVVKLHMRVNSYTEKWSNGAVRRLFLDAGEVIEDVLDLARADGTSDRNEPAEIVYARIDSLQSRLKQVQGEHQQVPLISPLNGNELMALFEREPGPWLKSVKQHLHDLVLDGMLQPGDKEGASAAAKKFLDR